jgi:SAM-dependent methyltransferase
VLSLNPGSPHYHGASGRNYFEQYQQPQARGGSFLNVPLYQRFVRDTDTVLDFACGSGELLSLLRAQTKVGVEINPMAVAAARARGIQVYERIEEVPTATLDVVISNHGLEHTLRPFDVLKELHRTVRVGGRLVLYVPADSWWRQPRAGVRDPNHHLYTWTPVLLSNLLEEAGWTVATARLDFYAWPPRGYALLRFAPLGLAQFVCRLCGILLLQPQVHALAYKEA